MHKSSIRSFRAADESGIAQLEQDMSSVVTETPSECLADRDLGLGLEITGEDVARRISEIFDCIE